MAFFARVKVKGLKKTNRILRQLGKRGPKVLSSALFQVALEIIGEAKKQVPVDFGHLRASGFVELPIIKNDNVSVFLGFGGPAGKGNVNNEKNKIDVGYALIVHENTRAHHDRGRAKYLEIPFNQAQSRMDNKVAFLLKEAEPRFR